MNNFVNLHTYTTNASLKSTITVDQLTNHKIPVVCITNPNLIDAVEFYKSCMENDKKPVIGLDINLAWGKVDMLMQRYNRIASKLTLIAKNQEGYKNLINLSTFAHTIGFFQMPRIDFDTLKKHSSGLICLINTIESSIALHYDNDNVKEATEDYMKLTTIFSKDNLYGEIFLHRKDKNLYDKLDIPHIITAETKYMTTSDHDLWEYYMAINENTILNVIHDRKYPNMFYYPNLEDWNGFDTELYNLWDLFGKIEDYHINQFDIQLPKMKITDGEFIAMLYKELQNKNLNRREYRDRLDYEIQTIIDFGYVDYFMMVKDIIDYCNAKLTGYVSAGRGSVGGCFIAYLLGITRIDPIHPYDLDISIPFDRFLNKGRKTLPDIDLDFSPRDRQPIIEYLKIKYGEDMCSNILTVTTMGARMAMRSVCRISGNLTQDMDNIIKSFPMDQHLTLDIIKDSEIYAKNEQNHLFKSMFDTAYKLEGLSKSYGIHASGIAISANDMRDIVPTCKFGDRTSTQYTQEYLEYLGIAKFDILGLNTLQVLLDTLNFILPDKTTPDYIEWLNNIAIDEKEVYYFLNQLHIEGIFQWDTHNYRVVIKGIQPHNFKELVDLNTLGRSAALLSGLTDRYIRRKNGIEPIEPLHPLLKGIMIHTMELPLYQEQIMQIFVALADYTQSEADDVRKAIGKKIPELMEKQKITFIERCNNKKIPSEQSQEIWDIIDKFSKYTWNLGHAVAYTRICYETAYLACRYPMEFYAACINNTEDSASLSIYINALKRRNIPIKNVDINSSKYEYIVKDGSLIAGLAGVKFISENTAKQLLGIRGDGFENWKDFEKRVPKKLINKTAIKSLFTAGAFDNERFNKDEVLKANGIDNELELLFNQYATCGRIVKDLTKYVSGYNSMKDLNDLKYINVLAYINKKKEIYTKKGDKMAFLNIEDMTGVYEVTVFPSVWCEVENITVGKLYDFMLSYGKGIIANRIKAITPEELKEKLVCPI